MNSQVGVLDIESSEGSTYTIVFLSEANIAKNKIPILTPIGTALLGQRAGYPYLPCESIKKQYVVLQTETTNDGRCRSHD